MLFNHLAGLRCRKCRSVMKYSQRTNTIIGLLLAPFLYAFSYYLMEPDSIIALLLYVALLTISALYVYSAKLKLVFNNKRKRHQKRITNKVRL